MSQETEAKEITELVVRQFNTMLNSNGIQGPLHTVFDNFELVFLSENTELVLEINFKVLSLAKSSLGKFFVRQKH